VLLSTTQGDIVLELDAVRAPESVKNFVSYVKSGYYDGLIFHRVIPNFMIQGGGFNKDMIKKATKAAIKNEAKNGLKNVRGSIAMARTSRVDSATSQFFINLVDNKNLDHNVRNYGYAVFGKVLSGMEVVDAIAAQPTGRQGVYNDVPKKPIIITKATVVGTE
jgi:cyclophilin family peptidyl-prolyl cis-trans isomerase